MTMLHHREAVGSNKVVRWSGGKELKRYAVGAESNSGSIVLFVDMILVVR